jgi:O-glycosyl hydrolase
MPVGRQIRPIAQKGNIWPLSGLLSVTADMALGSEVSQGGALFAATLPARFLHALL